MWFFQVIPEDGATGRLEDESGEETDDDQAALLQGENDAGRPLTGRVKSSKHKTFTQCCFNAWPLSATLAKH